MWKFRKQPNGLRYLRVGGCGQCLGAGKLEARKMPENAADSHTSGARFVGHFTERKTRLWIKDDSPKLTKLLHDLYTLATTKKYDCQNAG